MGHQRRKGCEIEGQKKRRREEQADETKNRNCYIREERNIKETWRSYG
jgi:hypothetical protein